ncbi:MAG TPA: assimilatory sulfite reductase (NADPH) flavoprotein subunit [Frateuria sp.]|uniref:assimilatory sulfite reductase (NADPH) flavoprotein subunit n=1 Tax=Frateuria sp. TaxID=2211372 RepID=UPI002DE3C171|nr:assimilatory sulfite reductase (NADPH) flavoprotein subunit [Frateuria sp.]
MNALVAPEPLSIVLSAEKSALLARLAEGLAAEELYWVAAWSAARAGQAQPGVRRAEATPASAPDAPRLTILYGSQTGNAKRVAEQFASRSEAAGLPVRLARADGYPQRDLAKETHLLVVISTQGDGEPPDDARGFVEFLAGKRAPRLTGLRYAVLGLGDSSYPQFCAVGRQLDERLAELGAARFAPLGEADVDVEAVAKPWSAQALEKAREALASTAPAAARSATVHALPSRGAHSREQPFAAAVLANQRIVSRDSERAVHHIELSLEGSGLRYAPGDALGVWPVNPPALVAQWLQALHLDGAHEVVHEGRSLPLAQWLSRERELTRLTRAFVAAQAAASGHADLMRVLRKENAAPFAELLDSHQPIDLLRRYRAAWRAEELVAALRPLTPRLYSIASSPRAVGEDEVHLTVAKVEYEAFGAPHWGAASAFLAAQAEDARVPVFIEANDRFRLPADDARDVIMIGPGTGVAPFRAFVQDRRETGARGRNWLFFGNRHFTRDFLYQVEWQGALKSGALHRLDLAFSRDTARKVYVQDHVREQGRELYAWLQGGAHLYVCGDANHMAKDVHAALVDIAVAHGGHSPDDARAWLADLLTQGRYARDVY